MVDDGEVVGDGEVVEAGEVVADGEVVDGKFCNMTLNQDLRLPSKKTAKDINGKMATVLS